MDIYFKHEDMETALKRVAPLFIKKGVNHKAFPYAAVQFTAAPGVSEDTDAACQLTAYIDTDVAIQTHVPLQACNGAGTMVASHRDMVRHFKTHAALSVLRKTQSSPFYMLSPNTQEETELRATGDTLLGGVFPLLDASLLQANGAFYRNDMLQACNFVKHAISENLPAQPRTPTERALGSVLFTPSAEKECTEVVATDGNLLAIARISPMITHPFLVPAFLTSRLKTIFKGEDAPVYKVSHNRDVSVLAAGSTRILCLNSKPVDYPKYADVISDFKNACKFETERTPLMSALAEFAKIHAPVILQISTDTVHVAARIPGNKIIRRASLPLTQPATLSLLHSLLVKSEGERVVQCECDAALLLRALKAFTAKRLTLACQLPERRLGIWAEADDIETATAFLLLSLRR